MRVLCIKPDAWPEGLPSEEGGDFLIEGKVYEVIDVALVDDHILYNLEGDENWDYWEGCFQRLPSIKREKPAKDHLKNFDEPVKPSGLWSRLRFALDL